VSPTMRGDKEVVLVVVKQNGLALEYASKKRSVRRVGWTLSHTRYGLSCFIAQIAFPLTTFGPRLSIHPAVINLVD
jgi:hypothetical protein